MLRIFHVSTLYRRISLYNVRYCIVGALRRRCFPYGKTTGRMISAPTRTVQPNFICKMFGIALSAHLRRRCFPMGKQPGGQRPPLGSPFGRAGERTASLRGRRQWQIWENTVIATWYPLSHGFQPCQLSHRESQGAGVARPAHRNFRSVILCPAYFSVKFPWVSVENGVRLWYNDCN